MPADTLDGANKAYHDAVMALADALERRVDYPINMAEMMQPVADEYGAEHAVERLFEGSAAKPDAQTMADLTAKVEQMLEARDQVDLITAKERETGGKQVVNIHGARYVVDTDAMVLRGADGSTISLDVPHAPQREPTASEQLRAVAGVEPAEPRPPESRLQER
jgi:hypothetical protein